VRGVDVEALSRRYGPMVLRRCRRLLGDEDEALDACQDVFLRVIEHRSRLNRLRDNRRNPATRDEKVLYEIARAEEPGATSEARLLLARLFGRHPESSRTIAVLHFVDGLTLEEVAVETSLSISGVRKRLRALRTTLTDMMAENPDAQGHS